MLGERGQGMIAFQDPTNAGEVNAVAMIIALCLASSIVDASPFWTSGALIVANAAEEHRDRVLSQLLRWGVSMIVVAPLLAWAIFILPGR
jgi:hypothetical protein